MAAHSPRSNGTDVSPTQPFRRSSVSSDTMSTSARSTTAALVPHANPPPAYVAGAEASDLISTELGRTVDITLPALTLLNEFLDHVLYIIICTSQSVGLAQLKAAIPLVLKPRLGKAALRVAEEELKDYIEDEEAEALYSRNANISDKSAFDVELVWKLARLRCMVYARMGDLEEEDEEEWLEREQLLDQAAALSTTARKSIAVTPGAAIFLTSIVEYLGEQALYYAAQHAQKRHDTARRSEDATSTADPQVLSKRAEILLDGKDMNHIGRDSPLSRLWRSWRRNTRSPAGTFSSPISPLEESSDTMDALNGQTSNDIVHRSIPSASEQGRASTSSILTPSRIPLPVTENDVDEIEGYGFVRNGVDAAEQSRRRLSMPVFPAIITGNVVPGFQERSPLRPSFSRNRSNSLPTVRSSHVSGMESPTLPQTIPSETLEEIPTTQNEMSSPQTQASSSPEHLNAAVGAIAGALGVVGVHHVRDLEKPQALPEDHRSERPTSQSPSPKQPLTSASIRGPGDFDMMYVPETTSRPEPVVPEDSTKSIPLSASAPKRSSYHELAAQQLQEHQRYSQHSHEMNTPSIYANHEHSPRFPRDETAPPAVGSVPLQSKHDDSRDVSPTPEQAVDTAHQTAAADSQRATSPDASSAENGVVVSTYAPTPEPRQFYSEHGYTGALDGPNPPWQQYADSPVSQMSGKHPAKMLPPTDEPVPELPKTVSQGHPEAFDPTAHMRNHSKSSSSSSRLLGFTRDNDGKPHSIYQQRAIGGMSDDMRRAHSATPDSRGGRPGSDYIPSPAKRPHFRIADSDNLVPRSTSNEYTAERSLEVLINSDETLHYTLTPATANFRDEDVNPYSKRTDTQDLADFFRNTAPPGQENTMLPSTRSRKTSMNATRAPQVLPVTRGQVPSSRDIMLQQPPRSKNRNPVGEPRDAKVDRMAGVRDLADYARSTGPSNDDQLPKPLPNNLAAPSIHKPVEIAAPNSPVVSSPKSPAKPSNRLKFQARDARPSRHAESAALVDFIRQGPPNSDRTRHTANSDDTGIASSQPKGSSDTNGFHSIAESQSPLLERDGKGGTAATSSLGRPKSQIETQRGGPTRTRRRPKDPYAIEDTDDESIDNHPKQTNEESLIDFLRNTAPATTMNAQPIMTTPQKLVESSSLNRANSFDRLKEIARAKRDTQSQARARAESPHLTQAGSKLDSYRPTQATHASHVDRNRNKPKIRNGVQRTESATTTTKGYGETADLADYLRNTGPTPTQEGWTQPLVDRQVSGVKGDGTGGLRKFFSMRGRK